jgi:hypothetical protein
MIFGRKESKLEVGREVVTNDENVLGTVSAVHDDEIEVTGGAIDRQIVWRIPRSAINRIDELTVQLAVSRGQAVAKGWEQHMASSGGQEATPTAN